MKDLVAELEEELPTGEILAPAGSIIHACFLLLPHPGVKEDLEYVKEFENSC